MTTDTAEIVEKKQPETTNEQHLNTLTLNNDPNIANAKVLLTDLDRLLKAHDAVVIDASSVETIDTSILQLLTVAVRDHTNLSCKNPSEVFIQTARMLGLEKHLGL